MDEALSPQVQCFDCVGKESMCPSDEKGGGVMMEQICEWV